MRRFAYLLLLPLAFAPANPAQAQSEGRLYEELYSERAVVSQCPSGNVESATYLVKVWGRRDHIGVRLYYFLSGERTPFLTYYGKGPWKFDFDRDRIIDKEEAVENTTSEWICKAAEQAKKVKR